MTDTAKSQIVPDEVLPMLTSTAKARFNQNQERSTHLFPTCLIDWNDTTAKSVTNNNAWLQSVECIVCTMTAFILTSTYFTKKETRELKIGIFTPWLKVTKHLTSFFSLSQWLDHKNKEENPWD